MDPPSENGFMTDVYSSPVSNHPQTEQRGWDVQVGDDVVSGLHKSSKKKSQSKKQKEVKKSKKNTVEDDAEIALWSPAKRQSWEARKTNPNAFYYRHVDPGVVKRTGAWDENEKEMFMKAIKLHPPTQGKWGLFAMNIPGRVGYQCRNFYHRLLESGELREDMIPGEFIPAKTRNTSGKKKKESKKKNTHKVESSSEQEEEVKLDSDSPSQEKAAETEEEEAKEVVIDIPPPPKEEPKFNIRSLKLFSTRVLQEDERLKKEAEEAAQQAISAFKQEEPEVPKKVEEKQEEIIEEKPDEEDDDVAIGVVEDKEASNAEIVQAAAESVERAMPPVLKWHPRMEAPWRVLGDVKEVIKFPSEHKVEEEQSEYQCSKIMRLNTTCPLNLLLLSFPAPKNMKNAYIKAVNKRLAENTERKPFNKALHAYFAAKDAAIKNPHEKDHICQKFVQQFLDNEI